MPVAHEGGAGERPLPERLQPHVTAVAAAEIHRDASPVRRELGRVIVPPFRGRRTEAAGPVGQNQRARLLVEIRDGAVRCGGELGDVGPGERDARGDLHRRSGGPLTLRVERRGDQRAISPHVDQQARGVAGLDHGRVQDGRHLAALEIQHHARPRSISQRRPDHQRGPSRPEQLLQPQARGPLGEYRGELPVGREPLQWARAGGGEPEAPIRAPGREPRIHLRG